MRRIMILGASILQLPAIKEAKKMGLEVIAVDMDKNAIGFNYSDISLVISTIDTDKVLEAAIKYKIDGIVAVATDKPVKTVAKVCDKLKLNGVSIETANITTNKYLMRKTFDKYKIESPEYFKASNFDEFKDYIQYFINKGKRCIIKPVDNSGSRGVQLVESLDKDKLISYYQYCVKNSYSKDIVVEEFMEGKEVSVETLSFYGNCHVIQITDKKTTGAPNFVELGHSEPSLLNKETIDKIKDLAIRANKAVGIKEGVSHTEIMVTGDGPKVVEIGARLGGDNISSYLVPLSTGVNLVKASIQIAIGDTPKINKNFNKASAIMYIESKEGIIKDIKGVDKARKIGGVKKVDILKNIGDSTSNVHSSNDRLGFVISQADTVKEALEICEKAKSKISIDIIEGR
ncbi:MAG: ATP-grasp domain-containing protein [Peptoniphilaceae bacterium]|nr:ATP-grasp domain-containing protein [Peptoniphilaceae bacterium]MDY6018303.1 ATP-grasp domain-containing protein [Anaerococcus sp.]